MCVALSRLVLVTEQGADAVLEARDDRGLGMGHGWTDLGVWWEDSPKHPPTDGPPWEGDIEGHPLSWSE